MITRVEECERENTELRINGEKLLEEEKKRLNDEVDELKKRELRLEEAISAKFEEEILAMQME